MTTPKSYRQVPERGATVTLFVTCVVDQFLPRVGIATVALLEAAGFEVEFPKGQTCCGQPAHSAGHPDEARRMAASTVECLAGAQAIVIPSGSCAAMIRHTYIDLLAGTPWETAAQQVASRTWELTELLAACPPAFEPRSGAAARVTVHDSCHGLRVLGIGRQARALLAAAGMTVVEMSDPQLCCGFGGIFAAMLPEVSCAMADDKLEMAAAASTIVAGSDAACLLHLEGRRISRGDLEHLSVRHIAELLADALPTRQATGPQRRETVGE